MLILHLFYKLLLFCLVSISFFVIISFARIIQRCVFRETSILQKKVLRLHAGMVLKIFSIRVIGELALRDRPCVYVCNHLSYLDAVVLAAKSDSHFITSTEMRDKAGIGWFCQMADCLYVDRKRIWNLPNEVAIIAQKINAGQSIILFPEGTTTSGHCLHEFKSPLIQAAIDAQVDVVPVTLNLSGYDGRNLMLEDRDYYCWYGSMDFLPHLFRLCWAKPFEVTLAEGPSLQPNLESGCRKKITSIAKNLISASFKPVEITC